MSSKRNTMNIVKTSVCIVLCIALGASIALAAFWLGDTQNPLGSAPGGSQTRPASSSVLTMPQANSVFITASTTCIARAITTGGAGIMLKFGQNNDSGSGGFDLTSNVGHFQAASTTVMYDAGEYGCGRWSGVGISGSATSAQAVITEFGGFQ